MKISFNLNGKDVQVEALANERLVNILRKNFNLLNVKTSCLKGQCGACTVLMNGKPVSSCLIPMFKTEAHDIITLEYFKTTEDYKAIASGFEQAGVATCGFCDAGKIFFTYAIMNSGLNIFDHKAEEKIRRYYSGVMCRCTSFEDLFSAIEKIKKIWGKK